MNKISIPGAQMFTLEVVRACLSLACAPSEAPTGAWKDVDLKERGGLGNALSKHREFEVALTIHGFAPRIWATCFVNKADGQWSSAMCGITMDGFGGRYRYFDCKLVDNQLEVTKV